MPGPNVIPTVQLKVETTGMPLMKLFVDHAPLLIDNGQGSADLSKGEHVLSWVVVGAPADSYSIAITSPVGAAWSTTAILDSSGKDAGIHWVEI